MTIAFYISGHGFGHASRQVEIINAFARRRPDVRIFLRTAAARWLLDRTVEPSFELDGRPADTGVVQIDSLSPDEDATADRAGEFHATFDQRADDEAVLLCARDVRVVVSDAPALGCEAASRAGIPSVLISNFTWDWIYEDYASFRDRAPDVVPSIQRAYRKAAAAWRLPMHGGFETFETIIDLPFVARHGNPALSRDDVLSRLNLPVDRPVALVSFGGYGASGLPLDRLDCLDQWTVVLTGASDERRDGGRVRMIADSDVYEADLRYSDLVRASDVVLTKPGYGIISECIANGAAMAYTSRGRFREYPVLVREMPKYLRCTFIDQQELLGGRWLAALRAAMSAPSPAQQPATNGADVAAEMLLRQLRPL